MLPIRLVKIQPGNEWQATITSWFAADNDTQSLKDMGFYSPPEKWFSLFSQDRYGLAVELGNEPVGFIDIDIQSNQAHIAYYIAPHFRKRGIGKASLAQLETYLMKHSNITTIHAFVDPVNTASQAVLESVRYKAGTLDEEGMIPYVHSLHRS